MANLPAVNGSPRQLRIRNLLVFLASALITGCALLVPHRLPDNLPADHPIVVSCAATVGVDPSSVATAAAKNPTDQTPKSAHPDAAQVAAEAQESQKRAMDGPGGVDWKHVGQQICSGIERAEGYHDAYFGAARWNVGFRNTAAALAIPLVGLTVREGLKSSPSQNKIAAFAVATVVLYGWSTQLTSKPRETVYFNGMQAMSCAIIEAQPVVVGVSELRGLGTQTTEVASARKALQKVLAKAGLSALTGPEDAVYVKALADADNAIARTNQFSVDLAKAAGQFLPLVEILAAEVDKNIAETEPNEQSLFSLVNGFGAQTSAITKAAVPPKTGTTDAAAPAKANVALAQGGFDSALREVIVADLADLVDKTATLNDLLSKAVSVADIASKVKSCKPAGVTNDFKVEPSEATAVVEVGKSINFTITNSTSVPSAHIEGDRADSITLNDIVVKGGKFALKVDAQTPTGDAGPTVVITDGTGEQQQRVTINVTAKSAAPAPAPAEKKIAAAAASAALQDSERTTLLNAALVPEDADDKVTIKNSVELLQCVVGSGVDGTVGSKTRSAIKTFRKSSATANADAIDEPLIGDIKQALQDTKKDCKKQP